jgi:ketosteroid isomerase-like protein
MKLLIATSVLLLSTAAAATELADEVRCREIGFSRAAEMRDAELFSSYIDADARFVGTSVLRGPMAIASAWAVFFAEEGPSIKWRPQFVEVLEEGTLALTRGPYRMIVTDEVGVQSERWGTFNSVWRKRADGGWKVVFDAGSDSGEPPPEAVRDLLDQGDDCS